MTTLTMDEPMARPKAPKSTPVRIADASLALARIASGYTGESVAEYVSRVIAEVASKDAERLHGQKFGQSKPKR